MKSVTISDVHLWRYGKGRVDTTMLEHTLKNEPNPNYELMLRDECGKIGVDSDRSAGAAKYGQASSATYHRETSVTKTWVSKCCWSAVRNGGPAGA